MRLALIAVAIVVAGPSARACSCAPSLSWADALEKADAVYLGRVAGHRPFAPRGPHPQFHTGLAEVALDVERWWKGPVDRIAVFLTEDQGSMCGVVADRGEDWIVVAFEREGRLYTDQCTSVRLADALGSPLDSLGAGHPPEPTRAEGATAAVSDGPGGAVLALLGLVALLSVVGGWLLRRGRAA